MVISFWLAQKKSEKSANFEYWENKSTIINVKLVEIQSWAKVFEAYSIKGNKYNVLS